MKRNITHILCIVVVSVWIQACFFSEDSPNVQSNESSSVESSDSLETSSSAQSSEVSDMLSSSEDVSSSIENESSIQSSNTVIISSSEEVSSETEYSLINSSSSIAVSSSSLNSSSTTASSSESSNSIVLRTIDYEDSRYTTDILGVGFDTTHTYGVTIVSDTVRAGNHAVRFELRASDTEVFNGTRAENDLLSDTVSHFIEGSSRFYGMSVFIPEGWVNDGPAEDILFQWKLTGTGPHAFLGIKREEFILRFNSDDSSGQQSIAPIAFGEWNDIVLEADWTTTDRGAFTISHKPAEDTLYTTVVVDSIATLYTMVEGSTSYLKWGLYCPKWNADKTTAASQRVVYFDEVRIATTFEGADPSQ